MGSLLGPLGDPLGAPWAPQGSKEGPKGSPKRGLERGLKPDPKKDPILDPLWRCSGELSSRREHSFQEFRGVPLETHFDIILGSYWEPWAPLFFRKSSDTPLSGPLGAPMWISEAFGAAVEPFFVTLIASAHPKSHLSLQNKPRGPQIGPKGYPQRLKTYVVLRC